MKKTMATKRLYKYAENLCLDAWVGGNLIAEPNEHRIRRLLEKGEDIPEHLLPGRMIRNLPREERKVVKQLKAQHFNHRIKGA